MGLFLLFLLMGAAILMHRRRTAAKLAKIWLATHGYDGRKSPESSLKINVLTWPIAASIVTCNAQGQRVRVRLSIGDVTGGFFNSKVACLGVDDIAG